MLEFQRRFRHGVFKDIGADLNVGFETFNEKMEGKKQPADSGSLVMKMLILIV